MKNVCTFLARAVMCAAFVLASGVFLYAQALPGGTAHEPARQREATASVQKVKEVDIEGLRKLLIPGGKPLLINFWATWCDPCREEFPDLVRLDAAYRDRVDLITVSLDDPADINKQVAGFLGRMKSEMPAYLLNTPDEAAAITMVSKEWRGNLPLTIIYSPAGETAYFRNGKIRFDTVAAELDKILAAAASASTIYLTVDLVKIINGKRDETFFYYENNWRVYREAALTRGIIHSFELIETAPDSKGDVDLFLITRYRGEGQYKNSEKNFEPILKELRPDGPLLKNDLKPAEFRQSVSLYQGTAAMSSLK